MSVRIARALAEVVEVVARLRAPEGCPWDRAQTHQSLVPYLLEEAYELASAVYDGDPKRMQEELGDLLLQILLHAQIEAEEGHFDMADVAEILKDKLIRRHPHVFGGERMESPEEVRAQWEELKRDEGRGPNKPEERAKPALIRASKFLEVWEAEGQPLPQRRFVFLPGEASEEAIAQALVEVVAEARQRGVDPELALHRFLEEHD